jgi:hypothetical protein
MVQVVGSGIGFGPGIPSGRIVAAETPPSGRWHFAARCDLVIEFCTITDNQAPTNQGSGLGRRS